MKMGSDIAPTLLLAGTLIVSSVLLMGTAQATDTSGVTLTAQIASDDARLSWKPPTTHVDGSGGLRLVHFNIFTRTSRDQEWQMIATVDAKKTTYTVENLSPGTHYFAVTAFCGKHRTESVFSNIESKEIPHLKADSPQG